MKSKLLTLAMATLFSGLAATALAAGSDAKNLTVQANVPAVCSLTTSTLDFGDYDPITVNAAAGADKSGTGALNVTCTKGSSTVSIALSAGGAGALPRRMTNGTDNLNYTLTLPALAAGAYTDCSGTTVWDDATNTLSPAAAFWNTGSTSAKAITVCGKIAKGQNVSTGAYADTVVATVNF